MAAQIIAHRANDRVDASHPAGRQAVALERLSAELCRWFGDEGCRVLLTRALTHAQRVRPTVAGLRISSGSPPVIEGLEDGLAAHGPAAMSQDIEQAMIATLDLLRRLIGEDLTARLAKRSTDTLPDAIPPPTTEGRSPMTESRAHIQSIPSGIGGLDTVVGGGLPEYSLNLIAGGPGVGKTTLAQQIAFAAGTPERPALYFTVLGEPAVKLLRYQSQFTFFDPSRVGTAVQFVNLSREVSGGSFEHILETIQEEVERTSPRIVVVDSFRTVGLPSSYETHQILGANDFVHRLAQHLTTWEATTFLIGEYAEAEQRFPVFTVADGILWMSQAADRNSVVRKLQVMKVRGRAPMPGLHTYRITNDGVQIFPRIPEQQLARKKRGGKRHTTGVPGLDEMIGGGVPSGDALMLAGPAGSGKTTFATQFIAEGLRCGEAVVVAAFEEYPREYVARAHGRDVDLQASIDSGQLRILYLRPLDLSVDEALAEILDAVKQIGAERVVIDSLSGFEIALAPAFREDFRESLYRLVGALTATGVTMFMTAEIVGELDDARFTTERVSFITDDIIVQRFIEIEGALRRVLVVVKMRGSAHSAEFREYEITANGAAVGSSLHGYHGILTGVPSRQIAPASATAGAKGT